MKKIIRNLYIKIHIYSHHTLQELCKKLGWENPGVVVLCYHNIGYNQDRYSITPGELRKHLQALGQQVQFVDLKKALELRTQELDRPAVALTFDDGYLGLFTHARKIVAKFGITPTMFLLSDFPNANSTNLGTKSKLMNIKHVKELMNEGWGVGSHGATHVDLHTENNALIKKEIVHSKKILEKRLRTKIEFFAYPSGYTSKKLHRVVKEAGYKAAFTIGRDVLPTKSNQVSLPRIMVDCSVSQVEVCLRINRLYSELRKLTDFLNLGRMRWI